jgi:hypothetical protein
MLLPWFGFIGSKNFNLIMFHTMQYPRPILHVLYTTSDCTLVVVSCSLFIFFCIRYTKAKPMHVKCDPFQESYTKALRSMVFLHLTQPTSIKSPRWHGPCTLLAHTHQLHHSTYLSYTPTGVIDPPYWSDPYISACVGRRACGPH